MSHIAHEDSEQYLNNFWPIFHKEDISVNIRKVFNVKSYFRFVF